MQTSFDVADLSPVAESSTAQNGEKAQARVKRPTAFQNDVQRAYSYNKLH